MFQNVVVDLDQTHRLVTLSSKQSSILSAGPVDHAVLSAAVVVGGR